MSKKIGCKANCENCAIYLYWNKDMFFLLLFFAETILIFFLSRLLNSGLSSVLMKFTRSKEITIHIISFLFLPGVIVHELSHLLTAGILFVKVGDIEFLPKIIDKRLKLGSVQIAQTDPIRRFVIGVAPLVIGLAVFFGTTYLLINNITILAIKAILIYFLFAVINTMFSSKKDMEGAVAITAVLLTITVLLYFVGLRVPLDPLQNLLNNNLEILKQADFFLSIPLFVDVVMVGFLSAVSKTK